MYLLDAVKSEDVSKLPAYVIKLFEALKPVLEKIDPDKIDKEESYIKIEPDGKQYRLTIVIDPKDKRVSQFDISACKGYFILGLAESEYMEDHSSPEKEAEELIKQVVSVVDRYISGITVVEHYDKRNIEFKKEYYWGVDSQPKKENLIGRSFSFTAFLKKSCRVEVITYSFV
jgi:hypothetical protein